MEKVVGWVLAHRLLVAVAWLVIAVVGGVFAPTTVGRLTYDFDLPGQPAFETNEDIIDRFGGGGLNDPLLVVARGDDAKANAAGIAAAIVRAVPGTRTVTPLDRGAQDLTSRKADVAVSVIYPPVEPGPEPYVTSQPQVESVVDRARSDGVDVELTGFVLLAEGAGGDRGVLVEILFGAAGALIVLAFVFGSLLAGVPLLVAAVSILGTFLALFGLTALTEMSFVVQFLVGLIGLGVAIDYSLLIVTRWREERNRGATSDQAVRVAMSTAGRSVLFSGVTVAVSLAALVLVPLPFLRSIGLGGLLIPLFSVATSLTLVPVVLSVAGGRLQWPRRKQVSTTSRRWAAIASRVLRRRWLTAIGTSVVLLALAVPAFLLTLGSPQLDGLASNSPAARAALSAVDAGIPAGVLRPIEVLTDVDASSRTASSLSRIDGVAAVAAPTGEAWTRAGHRLVQVYLRDDPASDAGRSALTRIRAVADDDGARVGGSPAEDADFVTAVYGDAGWVVAAVVIATFLLLAKALRSFWLPVKALVLNVISIAAAYGVTVLIWQEGYGSRLLFDQDATGVITTWVPIAAFAFLFGLSMDYEVFILARIRESFDDAGDPDGTDAAVVDGIAHTGKLVTSAAMILFLAFIALSTVPAVEVKILATALALGIIIDAVIVRGLLAPALVGALGRANWVIPRWLGSALRIRPDQAANKRP